MSQEPLEAIAGIELSRSQFIGRALALGASATALGTLLGCGSSSSSGGGGGGAAANPTAGTRLGSPPKVPTGTFTWGLISAPASIDQALVGDTGSTNLACVVSETLVRPNHANTDLNPWLATGWETSADAREWTFRLRPGVKFHDGADFDASAVKATFDHYKRAGGFGSLLVPEFTEVDDSDPSVIRLVTRTPAPDLARNLTFVFMMSPQHIAQGDKALGKLQVGTGAYKMTSMSSTSIELDAFEEYWSEGPYFEHVTMAVTPDSGALFNQLQAGSVDLATEVPAAQAVQLKSNPKVQVVTNDNSQRVSYLVVKTELEPMGDVRIRQAISYAIDRETLAKSVLRGYARAADGFEPAANYGGGVPMRPAYPFDVAKARSLIAAAGGGAPHVKLGFVTGATDLLAQAIAQQLRDAGFEVDVDGLEEGVFNAETFQERPPHNLYLTQYGWLGGGPLDYVLGSFQFLGNLDRTAPKANAEILAVQTKVSTLPDGPERLAAISQLQDLLAVQLPHIPVTFQNITDVISKRTQNYRCDGNLLTDLRTVYFSS